MFHNTNVMLFWLSAQRQLPNYIPVTWRRQSDKSYSDIVTFQLSRGIISQLLPGIRLWLFRCESTRVLHHKTALEQNIASEVPSQSRLARSKRMRLILPENLDLCPND